MKDLLGSREMRESGFYNINTISEDLKSQCEGEKDLSTAIFNIAQFQIWSNLNPAVPSRSV